MGFIAFSDQNGNIKLVYTSPIARLASATVPLPLEWDATSSSISVSLPELSFPLVLAFGLGAEKPENKEKFKFTFPWFKFGAYGNVENSSDEEIVPRKAKVLPRQSQPFSHYL